MMPDDLESLSPTELTELIQQLRTANRQLQDGHDLLVETIRHQEHGNSPDYVPAQDIVGLVNNYHAMTHELVHQQQTLQDQLRCTSLLMQLSIELRETLHAPDIVHHVLHIIHNMLHVANASIVLLEPDGRPGLAMSLREGEIRPIVEEQVRAILGRGLAGWVARQNRSVLISDISRDQRWLSSMDWHQQGSVIVVPIRQSHTLYGILTVHHATPQAFGSRELVLMEGVASQVAVAIAASKRFADEHRRHEHALALLSMSQFLTAEHSVDDLALMLHEQSVTVFGMDYGLLYLCSHQRHLAPIIPSLEHSTSLLATIPQQKGLLRHANAAARKCIEQKTVINVATPDHEPPFRCAAFPLFQRHTVIGACVLVRHHRQDFAFPATTWSLLTTFTNVVSAICANMRLVAHLRHQNQHLEQQVAQRTQQVQRSRDTLRTILDNLPEGLLLLDEQDRIIAANISFCQTILGVHPRSLVGCSYEELQQRLRQHTTTITETLLEPPNLNHLQQNNVVLPHIISTRRVQLAYHHDEQSHLYDYLVERLALASENEIDACCIERWRDMRLAESLSNNLLSSLILSGYMPPSL